MNRNIVECPLVELSYAPEQPAEAIIIKNSNDAARLAYPLFKACMWHHEEVETVYLNRRNEVIGRHLVSVGGTYEAPVDIKIVLQPAILSCANSIILFHNHPSNDPRPGSADEELTEAVTKAAELFGIRLLDHIIIASTCYYSFTSKGTFNY